MDAIDNKLMELLQTDSKRTTKELAHHLGLSNTAVYERVKRLEREGIIARYVALADKAKLNRAFTSYCHVRLSQHKKSFVLQFEREVLQLKEVVECYHVSGDYDYILKVLVADMTAYREFMVTKLTALKNIGSTQSSFVIGEIKYTTIIPAH
jgi:Lrp/AsnC family leucine-responsive transcriptional regulator